jgi:hypothetical protein
MDSAGTAYDVLYSMYYTPYMSTYVCTYIRQGLVLPIASLVRGKLHLIGLGETI